MTPRSVVLCSGGIDSVTLAHQLVSEGWEVFLLNIDYGQRHAKEEEYARLCAERLGVEFCHVNLSDLQQLLKGSALTDSRIDVPEGHYSDESMKVTVVPNRNAILANVAAGWAVSLNVESIALAIHAGDHPVYPDCRPEFVDTLEKMLRVATGVPLKVLTPFLHLYKYQIVQRGMTLGVPYAKTWSCYKGGELACGRCSTDVERKEAFRLAGVPDPTEYEDDEGAYMGS